MKEELAVYFLVAVTIILALSNGGYLLAMMSVLATFYIIDRKIKVKNPKRGKIATMIAGVSLLILIAAFVSQFLTAVPLS